MNVTVERVGNDATLKITLPAETKALKKPLQKLPVRLTSPASAKVKPPATSSKCTTAKKL